MAASASPGPLAGYVVCASAVPEPDRTRLEERVVRLAGRFSKDLTTLVTHLVTDSTDSKKYKVAVQLGIPVISTLWISALDADALHDGQVEPFDRYLLPPFKGVVASVSGYPTDLRQSIEQRVLDLGGAFTHNLSRDCTHLICGQPTGRKYEFATEWKLHVVSVDWLTECCKAHGRVDEDQYVLGGAGRVQKADDQTNATTYLDRCNVFLGDGFDETVLQFVRKIVRDGGGNMPRTCDGFVTHFVMAGTEPMPSDAALLKGLQRSVHIVNYKWLSACYNFKSMQPLEPYLYDPDNPAGLAAKLAHHGNGPIFSAVTFTIRGFSLANQKSIRDHLEVNGGRIDASGRPTYILVPFKDRSPNTTIHADEMARCVTEYWLEACIDRQTLLSPDSNALYRPTFCTFPIRGPGLRVGITGYESSERNQLMRAIQILGSTAYEKLSKAIQLLVCHPTLGIDSTKYQKAREWNIKVVDGDWVLACIAEGKMVGYDPYIIPDPTQVRAKPQSLRVLNIAKTGAGDAASLGRDTKGSMAPPAATVATTVLHDALMEHQHEQLVPLHSALPAVELEAAHEADLENQALRTNIELLAKKPRNNSKRGHFMPVEHNAAAEPPSTMPPTADTGDHASSSAAVGYKDPDGQSEKRRLLEQIALSSKRARVVQAPDPLAALDDHDSAAAALPRAGSAMDAGPAPAALISRQDSVRETPQPQPQLQQPKQPQKQRAFLFSAVPPQLRATLVKTITQLGGGIVLDTDGWSPECTHLIAGSPGRSEKFLAACAAGVWILKPSFVTAATTGFGHEEDHEWGAAADRSAGAGGAGASVGAAAARRWRLHAQTSGSPGSFADWKVLLVVDEAKRSGFLNVLVAGRAQVVLGKPSLRDIVASDFTHAIVDASKTSLVPKLVDLGLPVYDTQIVVEYLFNESPNLDRFRLMP
ncbi:hypothetical protein BC831DRAFT_457355 [Entophlyctis helioformis]|nr:hypothetical protein BC831DRAFT_457355 [Entophlyctis helioformis]